MPAEHNPVLSAYVLSFDMSVKEQYMEKIKCIRGIDLYVPENQFDMDINSTKYGHTYKPFYHKYINLYEGPYEGIRVLTHTIN